MNEKLFLANSFLKERTLTIWGLRRAVAAVIVPVVAVAVAGGTAGRAYADTNRRTVATPMTPWATSGKKVGDALAGRTLSATVYLAGRDTVQLEELVRRISNPRSRDYRHYLTPQQFRARFTLGDAAFASVRRWLTGSGLRITTVPDDRRYITVSGSVANIERAFGTKLSLFRYHRKIARAAVAPSRVPAQVASAVLGVSGLSDFEGAGHPFLSSGEASSSKPGHAGWPQRNPAPCSTYYGEKLDTTDPIAFGEHSAYAVCGYSPAQLRGAYGIAGQVRKGVPNGRGVTVAIVKSYASPTLLADANTWASRRGEPLFQAGQFRQVDPVGGYREGFDDGNSCNEGLWYLEQSLDVEAVHAMAPGAGIISVGASSCDDADQYKAFDQVVDQHMADIISSSWGQQNELDMAPELRSAYHQTLLQAACEGIGAYFASDDSGDNSLYTADHKPSVDFPASEPLATGVGGTTLAIGPNSDYEFETGWANGKSKLIDGSWNPNPPGNFAAGAGGGTSALYAQPYYQAGVVPGRIATRNGGLQRAVPDVAMDADPNTGLRIGWTQSFPDGDYYDEARYGGTSLSTPLFAGLVAVTDEQAGFHHGFINPLLYSLAGSPDLHDVIGLPAPHALARQDFVNRVDATDGIVTTVRSLGFPQTISVAPGYDDITGVGSPVGLLGQDPISR